MLSSSSAAATRRLIDLCPPSGSKLTRNAQALDRKRRPGATATLLRQRVLKRGVESPVVELNAPQPQRSAKYALYRDAVLAEEFVDLLKRGRIRR